MKVCFSFLEPRDETEAATTPANQDQSVTYSREASLVAPSNTTPPSNTTTPSNKTETEQSVVKADNVTPQGVEGEKTEAEKTDNEVERKEEGEDSKESADSKGDTDSKGGDEPKDDDIVQMHVIGHDENMKVKVLDQTSIAKV